MTESLFRDLQKLAQRAYAPYSRFRVAAILEDADGIRATGINVENASYGLTSCAERNAVFQFLASGLKRPAILYLYTETDRFTAPCGACRQVLFEFDDHLQIVMVNQKGETQRTTIDELVPMPFSSSDLKEAT